MMAPEYTELIKLADAISDPDSKHAEALRRVATLVGQECRRATEADAAQRNGLGMVLAALLESGSSISEPVP